MRIFIKLGVVKNYRIFWYIITSIFQNKFRKKAGTSKDIYNENNR